MTPQSPRSLAAHLAKYIADDSAIVAHVKRDFGVTYSLHDISRIRSSMPVKVGRGHIAPLKGDRNDKAVQIGHKDPLLHGIATLFEKQRPHEARHWRVVQQTALGVNHGEGQ